MSSLAHVPRINFAPNEPVELKMGEKYECFIDADPNWELLFFMTYERILPRLGNCHPWGPAFWNVFYHNNQEVNTRYRIRKDVPYDVEKRVSFELF